MAARIRWLTVREVYAFHDLALSEHGGMPGLRDAGLLESAVLRPKTAYEYGTSDLAELPAKLGFGLVSNHAFLDGNKRTAFASVHTFLLVNGYDLKVDSPSAYKFVSGAIAKGEFRFSLILNWLTTRIVQLG